MVARSRVDIDGIDGLDGVGRNTNMRAILLLRERRIVGEGSFAEIVIWRVPSPVPGSAHEFKYRLAFVVEGVCVIRFDNEIGKGDHKHIDGREVPFAFQSPEQLIDDFWREIENWKPT
jgi:Family of unknown function (DUF6516)